MMSNSSSQEYQGYIDELVWSSAWLYKATGEQSYLTQALSYYPNEWDSQWNFPYNGYNWDDKTIAVQVSL